MNISGIRPSAGFYDYNTIKSEELSAEQTQKTLTAQQSDAEQEAVMNVEASAKPDTGAMDYANRYQPDATYDLKGADSELMSLDVEKAISDMKRDQVLQQYQFFIGESQAEQLLESRNQENFLL
jgi:hypothetical protein